MILGQVPGLIFFGAGWVFLALPSPLKRQGFNAGRAFDNVYWERAARRIVAARAPGTGRVTVVENSRAASDVLEPILPARAEREPPALFRARDRDRLSEPSRCAGDQRCPDPGLGAHAEYASARPGRGQA